MLIRSLPWLNRADVHHFIRGRAVRARERAIRVRGRAFPRGALLVFFESRRNMSVPKGWRERNCLTVTAR